jgi:hypothetical protein
MITAVPLTQREANAFVDALHRHHDPTPGDKYRIGAQVDGRLVGVVQVGRPVSRRIDAIGDTVEVKRLCTDGTDNVCSFLYSAAARVAKELGYSKIITYILAAENGASLRAAGWTKEADVIGQSWDKPSRRRNTTAPTCNKQRWARTLK